ncbi:hypothetical protein ACFRAR_38665, partial [Kitasatospora sp. NPDC056651]|uniref:hypothetical protein n=1 Tax=Kitasatospora sp. NPDC056651 TaxID=3345892 RepID=UPI0036D1AA7A
MVFSGEYGHLAHCPVSGECGFDFAELDPEAADFDLLVGAAEVFQFAVVVPADEVAGAVHPFFGWAEGAGHEAFGGQAGALPVAACQTGSGEVELAGGAGWAEGEPG